MRRRAGSWGVIELERDAQPRARCVGEALEGPGRGLGAAAFEAGDNGLGSAHRLDHLRLRHASPAAGLDQGGGEGEPRLQRLVLGAEFRILQPLLGDVPMRCVCCSCHLLGAPKRQIDLAAGAFSVLLANTLTTTTRRPAAVT